MNLELLKLRAGCIKNLRRFFENHAYLEVDTPTLADRVIPEPTIELLETQVRKSSGTLPTTAYMLPSPELYMKRLIAGGSGSIFQLSRSFRNCEPPSRLHQTEFLMLEWYTVGANYLDSILTTEALIDSLSDSLTDSYARSALRPPFRRMSVEEAFRTHAGIDLAECRETDALREAAKQVGVTPGKDDDWPDVFHLILVSLVEPALPQDKPLVLMDYPVQVPCLAKVKAAGPWRERWELYLNGVETANCFSELDTQTEVAALFAAETLSFGDSRAAARTDHTFPDLYSPTHPPYSGVALGVDRLIMSLAGVDSISHIMPFPRG